MVNLIDLLLNPNTHVRTRTHAHVAGGLRKVNQVHQVNQDISTIPPALGHFQESKMNITFDNICVPFLPWKPPHGRVFDMGYAFDSETTLIDTDRPWLTPAYVLGAAYDGNRGVFLTRDSVEPFLRVHSDLPIAMHNAPFDLRVIDALVPSLDIYSWVDRDLIWDTQLLYRLLMLGTEGHTASGKGQSSSLEYCVQKFLQADLPKDVADQDGDVVRLSYGKWLNKTPTEIPAVYLEYLGKDVIATFLLFHALHREICELVDRSRHVWGYVSSEWLRQQFNRWGPLTHHIQMKAAVVLDRITENGLYIDAERRDELLTHLDELMEELKERLRSHGFLPGGKGSGKAMQEIMLRLDRAHPDLDFPRTPKNKYVTSREALEELGDVDFIKDYLQYKATEKLRSTFLSKMGRRSIHPSFGVLKVTGRTSSFGAINAQNLPREDRVRACFVPSPGHVFIDADYSTVEMATLAQVVLGQLQIPSRMASAINSGIDLHRLVAAQVMGKPEQEVTKEERQKAKPINFGKPGGMGNDGLKRYAKNGYSVLLSDDEVAQLTDSWFSLFPEMRSFLDRETDLGEDVARLFDLTPASYREHTGSSRYTELCEDMQELQKPNPFLGWMFLKTMRSSSPTTRRGVPYSPIEIDYFWTQANRKLALFQSNQHAHLENHRPSRDLWLAARRLADRASCFTLTGRLRAAASFCARHNTAFQGLAADGAKIALWKLWRAGFRIVNFIHDEVLIEVPEDSNLLDQAESIGALMIDGMKEVVPDVRIDVEYAACRCWSKSAEMRLDESGKLIPWSMRREQRSGHEQIVVADAE